MALELINVGSAPNDGTGDPERSAFIKVNSNVGQAVEVHNVKTGYGAVGDGVADDTAALQAAIDAAEAAGGGIVWLPRGIYKVSASLVIDNHGVALVGAGFGSDPALAEFPWAPATEILWTNATGAAVIRTNNPLTSLQVCDLGIDGNGQATKGLDLDMVQGSYFRNLGVRNLGANGIAFDLRVSGTTAAIGTQNNLFESLYGRAPTLLQMSGNATPNANCNYNCFVRLNGNFGDATNNNPGVVLNNGDNNTFIDLRLFRAAGTGVGIDLKDRARANYFFHVAPSAGGLIARTPNQSSYSNVVIGYDRENGQPAPVLESGANLTWTEDGQNATGWYVPGFGRIVGFGTTAPQLANSGTSGLHVQTTDGTAPEVRVQAATAVSASAFVEVVGRSGSSDVRVRLGALSGGPCELNVIPARPLIFRVTNAEAMRLESDGRLRIGGSSGPMILQGTGTPEASVTAPVGSLFLRTDGGASTTLYVKESGAGNAGWIAK